MLTYRLSLCLTALSLACGNVNAIGPLVGDSGTIDGFYPDLSNRPNEDMTPFTCKAAIGLSGEGIYCSDKDFAGTNVPAGGWALGGIPDPDCWSRSTPGELDLKPSTAKSMQCNAQLPLFAEISQYNTVIVSILHEITIDAAGVTIGSGGMTYPQAQLTYNNNPLLAMISTNGTNQVLWTTNGSSLQPPGGNFALKYNIQALTGPNQGPKWNIKSIAIIGIGKK